MITKSTVKKSNGANPAAGKNSQKVMANRAGNGIIADKGVVVIEFNEPSETDNNGTISPVSSEANAETSTVTSEAPAKKATQTKKVAQAKKATQTKKVAEVKKVAQAKKEVATTPAKKKAVATSKPAATNDKKIKLAASCYHYYRNWLKDFMRSHGVASARFQKSPESYNGHIIVLESEKVKGLKALETWNKENADTKEMFWDIKK